MVTQIPVGFPRQAFYPQSNRASFKSAPVVTSNPVYPQQFILLGGILPNNRVLKEPISVLVDFADGEYIVSEQKYYNYASRDTFNEALTSFLQNLSDTYESLLEEEVNLGDYLKEELEYLRSIISE